MSFDVNTFVGQVYNVLNNNNTTGSTYDISSSLASSRVQKIFKTYSEAVPIPITMYPVVFIEMMNKQEEFDRIGRSDYRKITCLVDVVAITHFGMSGAPDAGAGREIADKELFTLAGNIEKLFRNHVTLSTTSSIPNVDMVRVSNTDYNVKQSNDTWNSIARISLEISLHSN